MKIILISGKAEAGKTTAANFLKEELESRGERVAITPYGRLLKDLCNMLYGWDGQKDEAGRQLLQHFGTDVIRKEDPDYWVSHIIRLSGLLYNEFDALIVDDCRFPNELEAWDDHARWAEKWVKKHYDIYWLRIERPGYENHLTPEQRLHPSETALDGYELPVLSWINSKYVYNIQRLDMTTVLSEDASMSLFKQRVIDAFDDLSEDNRRESSDD